MDRCTGAFIWNGAVPHLARSTLQLPTQLGGLALPNLQIYYWAAVLVTAYWWFEGAHANVTVCLEAASLGSMLDLQSLVHRGLGHTGLFQLPLKLHRESAWPLGDASSWNIAGRRYSLYGGIYPISDQSRTPKSGQDMVSRPCRT